MKNLFYILLISLFACSSAPNIRYDGQFTEEGIYDGTGKITFSNDETWYGEFKNGVPYNGKGILYFYPGKFIKGVKNGDGEYYFPKGDKYIGEIMDGQKTGKALMFFYVDKSSYDGFYKNDKRNGQGTLTFLNGSIYEGSWKDDLANGVGVIRFNNGDVYEGEWIDSHAHGDGTFTSSNGLVYKGQFRNGFFSGSGKLIYTNNTTYEGQWNKNFANGNGTFVTRDGIIYSGTFKEGKINYSGSVTYATNQDYTQKGELFYRHGIDMESISLLRGELFEK